MLEGLSVPSGFVRPRALGGMWMATEGSRCSSHAPNSGLTFGPCWMACVGAGENVVWRADVGAVAPEVGAVAPVCLTWVRGVRAHEDVGVDV